MKTVLACPACNASVQESTCHRMYCDGGRKARPDERWICRECEHTFAEPVERESLRVVDRLAA